MARHPGRTYTHQYGNLTVTVKSQKGEYVAYIRRPSDGYEVGVGTSERTPLDAARFALGTVLNIWKNKITISELYPAAQELGPDINEFFDELPSEYIDEQAAGPFIGSVAYRVVYDSRNSSLGDSARLPIRGKTFPTQQDAEAALLGLYELGKIRPEDRDAWGVERVSGQGAGGEARRIRVS